MLGAVRARRFAVVSVAVRLVRAARSVARRMVVCRAAAEKAVYVGRFITRRLIIKTGGLWSTGHVRRPPLPRLVDRWRVVLE